MRIAQMVIQPVLRVEVRAAEALSDTRRGAGGFGSTGLKDARTPISGHGAHPARPD